MLGGGANFLAPLQAHPWLACSLRVRENLAIGSVPVSLSLLCSPLSLRLSALLLPTIQSRLGPYAS